MPEILEVEYYRRSAEVIVGREIKSVDAPDSWYLKKGLNAETVKAAMTGAVVESVDRIGKLMLLELADGPTFGLRYGMTGRLIVDENAVIDRLEYSPRRDEPKWDRLTINFVGGGKLRVQDPRRLGGVELEPDTSRLGFDAFNVTPMRLTAAIGNSTMPIKAKLMDQSKIAGLGNLLVDEILWRYGTSPQKRASSLGEVDVAGLSKEIRSVLRDLDKRGGSHTGDLQSQRHRDGVCPMDGELLMRAEVGGRTSYWCPAHQQ